jgi:nucleoside-diphosphate-sugar epimerase
MKILITGGTGMVGKAINDLINGTYECKFLSSKDIDLRKYESTYYYFRDYQPTHVIHLAANVGGLYKNMANAFCRLWQFPLTLPRQLTFRIHKVFPRMSPPP